jgi:uncharacterized membrane protein YuzA (DUF378 family)
MTFTQSLTNNPIKIIANILVIIGALNWLSIGLQNTNYVSQFAGNNDKMIFIIVGIAGIYLAYNQVMWMMGSTMEHMSTNITMKNGKLIITPIQDPNYS